MTEVVGIERANTILYCATWGRTVEFYRDTLGFRVTHENDWFVEFAIGDHGHLSIADADRATIDAVGGAGITLSWQVPDIDEARHALLARGLQPGAIHRRWGSAAFHLRDPEGHRIELWA